MTASVDLTVASRPVRPWESRPSAPDQFPELQRHMKAAGLLDPRPGYYTAKITFNLPAPLRRARPSDPASPPVTG